MKPQAAQTHGNRDIDRRLVVLAKRAFRVAKSHRRDAFLDHIGLVMGCTKRESKAHLLELEEARYVFIRGAGPAGLVYSTDQMDTPALKGRGIVIR